ncbi:MAG TPA: hypothetical protein VI168_13225 [Croceibacterium sp.]
MRWTIALVALIAMNPVPAAAQDEWPRETRFEGPLRFCSYAFAVEVGAGESAIVRDPGLDFTITYLESGASWIGVYQGNFPQTTDKKIKRTRFFREVRVDRMTAEDGATSYLIHALPDYAAPVYLHVFSNQFVGTDADKLILQRLAVGTFAKTGCSEASYRRS